MNHRIKSATRWLLCALLLTMCGALSAQSYPSKPIRWLLGYPPGGGSDYVARQLALVMSKDLGVQLLVDNRPGAATIIATDLAAKSPPDGYTIFTGDNGSLVFNPLLYDKVPYDPVRDFTPVSLLARFHMLLVVPQSSPIRTAGDLLAQIRRDPGKLNYASPGEGSPHHLAMEMFKQAAGLDLIHVPYKGAAPAVTDLIGGQVSTMFLDLAAGLPQIKGEKVRALAVASPARIKALPNVPTLQELGFAGFEAYAWQGLVVPSGTPKAVVSRLEQAVHAALNDREVRERLSDAGVDPIGSSPEDFRLLMQSDKEKWAKLIQTRNIRLRN